MSKQIRVSDQTYNFLSSISKKSEVTIRKIADRIILGNKEYVLSGKSLKVKNGNVK